MLVLALNPALAQETPEKPSATAIEAELQFDHPGFDLGRFELWRNDARRGSRLLSTERDGIISYRTDGDKQWLFESDTARARALHAKLPLEGRMRVWFPGIRSAAVIQNTFEGRSYVYVVDPGRPEDADGLVAFIRSLGVDSIDAVLISHAHFDHYGGLGTLVDAFPVGRLYLSGWLPSCSTNVVAFQAILRHAVLGKRIPFAAVNEETPDLGWPGLQTRILAPKVGYYENDEPVCGKDGTVQVEGAGLNANSVVLQITAGRRRVLLPGDATPETMRALVKKYGRGLASDLLLAPHHGLSYDASFARAVNPYYTIINWDHPNEQGLRLARN